MRYFLLFILLSLTSTICAEPLRLAVNAESAIVINADTGAILYQKNPHKLMYPASVTKISTALYALKNKGNQLDEIVTIEQEAIVSTTTDAKKRSNYSLPAYWLEPDSTHMGLKNGEKISFKDLLYGMLLVSANDASNSIAIYTSGSIPSFMEEVNQYLKSIGCKNTHFCNPNGLFHPKHQTTAYDLALMTKEALKDPTFTKIVSTVQYPRAKTNKQESTTLVQSNKLLRKGKTFYPKAIGVKTGYTSASGHTFVAAARQDDRTLIAVLLKSKERNDMFNDAVKIFESAFNQTKVEKTYIKAGPQKFNLDVEGANKPLTSYTKEDLKLSFYPAEEPRVKCLLFWDSLTPPISKDQRIGLIKLTSQEGQLLAFAPLLAQEDAKTTWFYFLTHLWKTQPTLFIISIIIILGFILFLIRKAF